MRRPCLIGAAAIAIAAACEPHSPPLNVPGPTVAHPPGYSPTGDPAVVPPAARVLAHRTPGANVVALRVVFQAGSADDLPGKDGLTWLTATTMAEGGTTSLTYTELLARLYPFAASIDVHVDRDQTVFSAEVTRAELDAFYPVFEQIILAPRLDAEGFERVRAKARSYLVDELRGSDDEELGKEALEALLYEGHPYGHPAVGTERGLATASLADVKEHRARVLCRDRVVVGLEGGFPEGFDARVATGLGALPGCATGAERPSLPEPRRLSGFHVLVVDKPTADSTAISLGYAYDVTRASPDFPAIAFFADYIGLHRQSSGLLYDELREKRGLNYGDYAYAEHFEQDGWEPLPLPNVARRQQSFSIWIRPVKPEAALFALHAALYEYARTLDGHVPQAEIERYRAFLTRHTTLEQLTPSRRIGFALDDLTYGAPRPYLDTMHGAWRELDEGKLAEATRRHLTRTGIGIAIVSRDAAKLAAALVAGAPPRPPRYDSPKPKAVTLVDEEIARFPVPLAVDAVRVVPASELFKQ